MGEDTVFDIKELTSVFLLRMAIDSACGTSKHDNTSMIDPLQNSVDRRSMPDKEGKKCGLSCDYNADSTIIMDRDLSIFPEQNSADFGSICDKTSAASTHLYPNAVHSAPFTERDKDTSCGSYKDLGDCESLSCREEDAPLYSSPNMLDSGRDCDAGDDYARKMLQNLDHLKLHSIARPDMSTLLLEGSLDFGLIPERDQETFTPLYQHLSRFWRVNEKSKVIPVIILENAKDCAPNTTADYSQSVLPVEESTDSDEFTDSSFEGYFVIYQNIYQEFA